jgi:Xaa-Pro aminopeptidase
MFCLIDIELLGHALDILARTALWEVGLDYCHGTGHGVGSFLNVHEGETKLYAVFHFRFVFCTS